MVKVFKNINATNIILLLDKNSFEKDILDVKKEINSAVKLPFQEIYCHVPNSSDEKLFGIIASKLNPKEYSIKNNTFVFKF